MPKKVDMFGEMTEVPFYLIVKTVYCCENCGYLSEDVNQFKKGTKIVSDQGGVISETHKVPRLVCPSCEEELEA